MTIEAPHSSLSESGSVAEWHTHRMQELQTAAERESTRSGRVANVRFALFVVFVGALAYSEARMVGNLWLWLAAIPFLGFVAAVVVHQRIRKTQARLQAGIDVHQDAIHRSERDWDAFGHPAITAPPNHPYADDLDVIGSVSLTHLLSAVRSPAGRALLRSWLLDESARNAILDRQAAVTELTAKRSFRERIEVAARMYVRPTAGSLTRLRTWLSEETWLASRTTLLWFSRVSTVVTLALLAAHLSGVVPYAFWLVPVMANLVVSRQVMRSIHPIFERATSGEGAFVAYENILRLFAEETLAAPRLVTLRTLVRSDEWSAPEAIAHFRRIASLAEIRRSFVGPVLQAFMMWDVRVLRRLEAWRNRFGEVAISWFDVAAEIEVLCVFGGLNDDNPNWCMPSFTEGEEFRLDAKKLAHPLLTADTRIANDVTIGPTGTFVFVTGSNMSGKSTLLRAVGCNVVLAQAGAPVCCESLSLPAVLLHTNMRVSDSLASGESYYLAALRRLKRVIDASRAAQRPGRPVLYLLDEILQGTNSAERKIAVQGVMRELVELHTIGAITSHDLSLIDEPDLESVAESVHFTETVSNVDGQTAMSFDYRLRPGIAPSQNALRLMEIIGLRSPNA